LVAILKNEPLPVSIISTRLGQNRVSGQLKVVLKRMVVDRMVEFTIPEKPNSRLQKYRLVGKSRKRIPRGNE
jgi:hypothetical protein